ncbi:apoptosis regulatory protein Siva [Erpetoichthys calabaricus]|nr:apoptosis regulatory protein Siva [Erpetoichthys calabaricus]
MPKRSCPWRESIPVQMKMHVTQKEVNEGVARDVNMKAVYDRTRELLYSGARSLKNINSETGEMKIVLQDQQQPLLQEPSRGQLRLGPQGKLLKTPTTHAVVDLPQSSNLACALCSRQAGACVVCAHCEKSACRNCQRCCSQCQRDYCFMCCVVNYDEQYERLLCADCPSQ